MKTIWVFRRIKFDTHDQYRLTVIQEKKVFTCDFFPSDYESQEDYKRDVVDCIRSISKRLNKKWWQFWL